MITDGNLENATVGRRILPNHAQNSGTVLDLQLFGSLFAQHASGQLQFYFLDLLIEDFLQNLMDQPII